MKKYLFVINSEKIIDIWYKNSLAFKQITFGTSDIDLVIYINDELLANERKRLLSAINFLRCIFPILGEVSIYNQKHLDFLNKVANPYELARDPELAKRLDAPARSKYMATSYILHALFADIHNLNQNAQLRAGRWSYVLKDILSEYDTKVNFDKFSQEQIWNLLKSILDDSRIFDQYLNQSASDIDPLQVLRPCQNIYDENGFKLSFNQDIFKNIELSRDYKKLIEAEINWEIYGIYSQLYFTNAKSNLFHLRVLKAMMCSLHSSSVQEFNESLRKMDDLPYNRWINYFERLVLLSI